LGLGDAIARRGAAIRAAAGTGAAIGAAIRDTSEACPSCGGAADAGDLADLGECLRCCLARAGAELPPHCVRPGCGALAVGEVADGPLCQAHLDDWQRARAWEEDRAWDAPQADADRADLIAAADVQTRREEEMAKAEAKSARAAAARADMLARDTPSAEEMAEYNRRAAREKAIAQADREAETSSAHLRAARRAKDDEAAEIAKRAAADARARARALRHEAKREAAATTC